MPFQNSACASADLVVSASFPAVVGAGCGACPAVGAVGRATASPSTMRRTGRRGHLITASGNWRKRCFDGDRSRSSGPLIPVVHDLAVAHLVNLDMGCAFPVFDEIIELHYEWAAHDLLFELGANFVL